MFREHVNEAVRDHIVRTIPDPVKQRVLTLWLNGSTYREIGAQTGLAIAPCKDHIRPAMRQPAGYFVRRSQVHSATSQTSGHIGPDPFRERWIVASAVALHESMTANRPLRVSQQSFRSLSSCKPPEDVSAGQSAIESLFGESAICTDTSASAPSTLASLR